MGVDRGQRVRNQGCVAEVLAAAFVALADQGGEGEFSLGGVKQLVLNVALVSGSGSPRFDFIGAEGRFDGHDSGVVFSAANLDI